MAEDILTETVTETETETVTEQPIQTPPPETGESAEARIARMEAALKKANSEAASHRKKLEAIEKAEQEKKDAELSELEKTRKRLAELEAEATKLKRGELQRQAAEKAKLPPALAGRLQGETLEDLIADAEELAKTLPKPQAPPLPPTNPAGSAANNSETDAERRARLYGTSTDLYNPAEAAKHGGGVVFNSKE